MEFSPEEEHELEGQEQKGDKGEEDDEGRGQLVARSVALPRVNVANDASDEESDAREELADPQGDNNTFGEERWIRELPRHGAIVAATSG